MEEGLFCKAKPVFVPGRADKPDTLAAFRCDFTAEKGETLSGTDSRNHGFGAYYGALLMRGFLGMEIPDRVQKAVRFAPRTGSLRWAKGTMDPADGRISAYWRTDGDGIRMEMSAPRGYRIEARIPREFRGCRYMTVNGENRETTEEITAGNRLSLVIPSHCGTGKA